MATITPIRARSYNYIISHCNVVVAHVQPPCVSKLPPPCSPGYHRTGTKTPNHVPHETPLSPSLPRYIPPFLPPSSPPSPFPSLPIWQSNTASTASSTQTNLPSVKLLLCLTMKPTATPRRRRCPPHPPPPPATRYIMTHSPIQFNTHPLIQQHMVEVVVFLLTAPCVLIDVLLFDILVFFWITHIAGLPPPYSPTYDIFLITPLLHFISHPRTPMATITPIRAR